MEYEKIKQLIKDMGESKLEELSIDFPDGTKISMKKECNSVKIKTDVVQNVPKEIVEDIAPEEKEEATSKNVSNVIKSPMVGTFYSKPSPDADPYVSKGANVKKGSTVCIIEAMKLMNEIESEYDGEVVEVYVKDGDIVEYGTPLFGIK